MRYCVIILLGLALPLDAYLILQMRKGNRTGADVDTLIHKSGENRRKSGGGRMHHEDERGEPQDEIRIGRHSDVSDLSFGLDTGARRNTGGVSQVIQMLSDAFDRYFRTNGNVKSVRLQGGTESKRSLSLELKSESILRSVEDFLASPSIRKAASDLARKAAIVYKAIENDL